VKKKIHKTHKTSIIRKGGGVKGVGEKGLRQPKREQITKLDYSIKKGKTRRKKEPTLLKN